MLLPFLEQTGLYNSINFVAGGPLGGFAQGKSNQTVAQTKLTSLVCPSDPIVRTNVTTNYGWNGGFGLQTKAFVGTFRSAGAPRIDYINGSSITDGLSNTSAASEWRIGAPNLDDDSTIVFNVNAVFGVDYPKFIQDCQTATKATTAFGSWTKDAAWYREVYGSTMLNFNSTPNSHNCQYGFSIDHGNWPCSSYHSGGVNMLVFDNHVHFLRNTTALPVLQSMSTKSGGDSF